MRTTLIVLCSLITMVSLHARTQPVPDSVERAVIDALNVVRTKPKDFVPVLERYRIHMRSYVKDVAAFESALRECKVRLLKQKALPPLIYHEALQGAAEEHGHDTEAHDMIGHIGSDRTDPAQRVFRHAKFTRVAECIAYGQRHADYIVAALLVDHDTPSRAHREYLLSPDFDAVGVSVVGHQRYDRAAVIVLAHP